MKIRVGERDQKHFGVAEVLEFDPRAITVAELEELSERFGFDPNDWPDPLIGELTLEQAGDPDAKPTPPRWRNHAYAWMLLRQNGCDVTWDEAGHFRFFEIEILAEDEAPESGKGSTGETP